MDFVRLCREQGIPFRAEGHHHCRPGWVQVHCPFRCGTPNWTMGYSIAFDDFHCWRCGRHSPNDTVGALLNIHWSAAKKLIAKCGGKKVVSTKKIHFQDIQVALPIGAGPLAERHRDYLEGRNFDPDRLIATWGLLGTGHLGEMKQRIIAPIFFKGQLSTFQGRDITDRARQKYLAPEKSEERIPIKELLYGLDYATGASVIVVEGITDVWRLGPGAVATFGIDFTIQQALLLSFFRRRFILFDAGEDAAKARAKELAILIETISPGETEVIDIGSGDPASLSQQEADHLKLELLR